MNILANENVPLASVRALRKASVDIVSLSESSPGINGATVLQFEKGDSTISDFLSYSIEMGSEDARR